MPLHRRRSLLPPLAQTIRIAQNAGFAGRAILNPKEVWAGLKVEIVGGAFEFKDATEPICGLAGNLPVICRCNQLKII